VPSQSTTSGQIPLAVSSKFSPPPIG
jgi:hypothetical protein